MKISLSILKRPDNWKWLILDVWDFSTSFWINRSDPWIYFRWRAQVKKEVISILMQNTHWWSINWRCGLATLQGKNYFLIPDFPRYLFCNTFLLHLPKNRLKSITISVTPRSSNGFFFIILYLMNVMKLLFVIGFRV